MEHLQSCECKFGEPGKAFFTVLGCYQEKKKKAASKMRLSPLNIIMHKSIIRLQQHRKQHATLTFTIYTRSEERRCESLTTCTPKG